MELIFFACSDLYRDWLCDLPTSTIYVNRLKSVCGSGITGSQYLTLLARVAVSDGMLDKNIVGYPVETGDSIMHGILYASTLDIMSDNKE